MLTRLRTHLTYANVVSTLCLFVLLGGVAWAASLPRNSVGPAQIKRNAVGGSEIKRSAVGRSEIRENGVGASELRDGTLTAQEFAPGVQLQGPPGQKGDRGLQGEPATRLFAYVNSDGSIAFQSGVTGIDPHTPGSASYILTFNRSLAGCAVLAQQGRGEPDDALNQTQGGATATPNIVVGNPTRVQVTTLSTTHDSVDRGFFIAAFC